MRKTSYFPFKGGVNTEQPALSIAPGELIDAYNYEPSTTGGYRRVDGFERWDGRELPSEASYYLANFDAGQNEPAINSVVRGASSAAEGVVLAVVVESGAFATNDATGYLIVHIESGNFVDDEVLTVYAPDAFSSGFSAAFA